jgi:Sulfatase-modifying factor enzyme 1/Caspase domain
MGRFALLLGNSQYEDKKLGKLARPEADVRGLAEVLKADDIGGFDDVSVIVNASWYQAQPVLTKFFKDRQRDDFLLVFFAGHGVRDSGGNLYLTFRDTEVANLDGTAIRDSFVARQMDQSRAECQLLILDCCYSGAFGREARAGVGVAVGLRDAYKDVLEGADVAGRVILTATNSIQFAWEGDQILGTATNSVFTHFLIRGLKTGEADLNQTGLVTVDQLYEYLYRNVRQTNRDQEPQLLTRSGRSYGDLPVACNPAVVSTGRANVLPEDLRLALIDPNVDVRAEAVATAERFLSNAATFHAVRAFLVRVAVRDKHLHVRRLAFKTLSLAWLRMASSWVDPRSKLSKDVRDLLPAPFEWCKIPSGYIKLRKSGETYNVPSFSMAKYPVTYEQFQVFVDSSEGYSNDEWWIGLLERHERPAGQHPPNGKCPRVYVSWYEAIAFCRWLSSQVGYSVRLPTEWEWEWAASSAYGGEFPWGDQFRISNCNTQENGQGQITPVDRYSSGKSQFGVYDMSGNIWERCLNLYDNPNHISLTGRGFRVIRGGSWRYPARLARTHHRHLCIPEKRFNDGGFRVAAIFN